MPIVLAIGRWFIRGWLMDHAGDILATLAIGIVTLVMTIAWSLGIMAQPGGIYWLASQAPPDIQAAHPLVPVSVPLPFDGGAGNISVGGPLPNPPGSVGHWIDGPTYNQFLRANWQSQANFAAWSPAACSTAALAWMFRAYGQPVQFLDDALAYENPPVGITTGSGLSDHTGTQLALALGRRIGPSFKKHFASTADLISGLRDGPLMMDGFAWFGVGHWFVATGVVSNDKGEAIGISVRESSGHDITYLSWAQLYGAVGWSGWAVGVLP